jgi:signal transduction histidine kinase
VSRFTPRRLLTDASLAAVLIAVTLGPGLVGRSLGVEKSGAQANAFWWMLAGLVVAGLLVRQAYPVVALALTAVGTLGHLVIQTKFQLLDLALPLALYPVATDARRRRVALALLGTVMALTYAATLTGRLLELQQTARAEMVAKQQIENGPAGEPVKITKAVTGNPSALTDIAVDTSQAVLEMWLLLIAAFAVGDGTRSRRAHLAEAEQRSADLARQERQRAALAVAAERARITRELHDVVAHGISVMVVQAQGAAAALGRHPERAATALEHVIGTGRSSLTEMRRLLAAGRTEPADDPQLAPPPVDGPRLAPPPADDPRLAPLPGIGALPALVDQLRSAGMRVSLSIEDAPEVVPPVVELSAYRIVQEALTNTLKHAGPGAAARVRLAFDPQCLHLEVTDDGTGMAEGADGRGNGLRGIAERVAMLGGEVHTGPGDEGGFRLSATLPLAARVTAET